MKNFNVSSHLILKYFSKKCIFSVACIAGSEWAVYNLLPKAFRFDDKETEVDLSIFK